MKLSHLGQLLITQYNPSIEYFLMTVEALEAYTGTSDKHSGIDFIYRADMFKRTLEL